MDQVDKSLENQKPTIPSLLSLLRFLDFCCRQLEFLPMNESREFTCLWDEEPADVTRQARKRLIGLGLEVLLHWPEDLHGPAPEVKSFLQVFGEVSVRY